MSKLSFFTTVRKTFSTPKVSFYNTGAKKYIPVEFINQNTLNMRSINLLFYIIS